MAVKWEETLIRKCYEVMPVSGEVRIQFSIRGNKSVPIIRIYKNNQIICDEIELDN